MDDENREALRTPLGRERMLEEHEARLDGHDVAISEVRGGLGATRAEVGVFKRVMYWVAVLLTGSIIALIGAAVTIVLTAGGASPK